MNFYKHHIGDYASATEHLTWDEDMAYTRLLRVYYRDEKPLPSDELKLKRAIRCAGKRRDSAIRSVLKEFFTLEDDGWHNKRADAEIAKANAQAAANREVAERREAARLARIANESFNESLTNRSTNRSPAQEEVVNLSRLQTPDSRLQTPTKNKKTPKPPLGKGAIRERRSPRRTELDEARLKWQTLLKTGGAQRDPRVQSALNAVGGWQRVAQRTSNEEPKLIREFCDAYRQAVA